MTLYRACKSAYYSLISENVRQRVYDATPASVNRVRAWVIRQLERGARHDEIYDAHYYQKHVEAPMARSAGVMADAIVAEFRPSSAIDVGCGTGALLAALQARGLTCRGYEYADAAIEACRRRGLDIAKLDIESDPIPDARADVAISTEVAEHLPERIADRFVELMCTLGQYIVLTAAIPGQGGTDHVNEQPNEYWIAKFQARGRSYDAALTRRWRESWAGQDVAGHLASNVMVFRKH